MYILPIHDDGPWGNINCTPPLFPHPTSYFPRNFQAGCKIMLQSCQLKQGFFCCIFFEYYFLLYISQGLFFAIYVFLKWSLLVLRLVSTIFQIVHFLVHSNFDLVSSLLALLVHCKCFPHKKCGESPCRNLPSRNCDGNYTYV